jgi:hypothetical protein
VAANPVPEPEPESSRPFPAQKCYLKGCERENKGNLCHAGNPRLISVKGTDGKKQVPIYPMRCGYHSPHRHLHTAYLGPHGERLTPGLDENGTRKRGCWIFTDAITGQTIETESAVPRANGTEEKRAKQSKSGKLAWRKHGESRKAAISAFAKALYGDSEAPDTWTPEQKAARALRGAESKERYGDPDHPETWTPEQKAARAKVGEGQDAFWAALSLTPRLKKSQIKRRTAHNSRPEVRKRVSDGNLAAWKVRKEKLARAEQADAALTAAQEKIDRLTQELKQAKSERAQAKTVRAQLPLADTVRMKLAEPDKYPWMSSNEVAVAFGVSRATFFRNMAHGLYPRLRQNTTGQHSTLSVLEQSKTLRRKK